MSESLFPTRWAKDKPRTFAAITSSQRAGSISVIGATWFTRALDRMYAEVSNEQSGVSGAIKALVAKLVPTAAQPIDLAPLAGRVASVETALKDRPTFNDVAELLRKWFDAQWQAWVAYTDKRLLNLIWDRSVKLLRYKETSGKSAAQLPVNDPKNLEV